MSDVLKLVRKAFTVGVTFMTILWSVGVAAFVPAVANAATCPALNAGDMLKVSGKPAIYAVNNASKVLYFPSGDEFKSWRPTYGGYISVTQACFDSLQVPSTYPGAVNYHAGSFIVKRPSSDQIYVVEPNNTLATITVDAAKALYGAAYTVMTVADPFWPHYVNRGTAVTEAKVHPGMLVSNAGKNWYVDTDLKLREVTATGFTANGFQTRFVRPVADSAVAGLSQGAVIDAEVPALTDKTQSGGVTTTPTPVTGGALTVALAADNPAAGVLASGTSANPVLKLTLTAGSSDVKVTGLTVRKSGFVANTNISGVDVIDSAGARHGNVVSSLSADNDATLLFSSDPVIVKAGGSNTVTVRVNMGANATGGTVQMSLLSPSSVTTDAGSVSGNFPVTGNSFSLQNGSGIVASVTLNTQTINATGATYNVDPTNQQEISKFVIANSSNEAVKVGKLTLYNNGTAADTDVQDVQLAAQDGTVLATAQQVSKNVVFDLSANPYLIDKGLSKTLTVRAKIVNGAARTIQFVVYNDYDLVATGVSTLANVLATTNDSTGNTTAASFPVGNKSTFNTVTVGSGSLSFNKDVSSPSAAVTPASNSVVIGKWFAKPTGENMELRQITLAIATTSGATDITGSFVVRVNGASVYSADPSTGVSHVLASPTTLTLSTYPTLTAGQNNYVTVETNISASAANTDTVQAKLDLTSVKRLVTNDITDPAVSASAGNLLVIQAGALKVTTLAQPVAQSVVPGATGVTLATVELNPSTVSSGEDVRVTKVIFSDIKTGTGALYTDIANLVLYDAQGNALATTGSTAVNAASTTFNFSQPIVVSKTGSTVLTLKGDIIVKTASDAETHAFGVHDASHVTAVGVMTGNLVTGSALTKGTGNGQAMTIASAGTLTLSLVSGTNGAPALDQLATVGSANNAVYAFKLSAQNEALKVSTLKLTATGTSLGSNDLLNLKLYRNSETAPFATAGQMTCSSNTCTYTWTAPDNLLPSAVEPGAPVTIYVKADIGPAGAATLGNSYRFNIASSTADVVAKGAASGTAATVSGTPAGTGFTYVVPFSVVVTGDAPSAGSSATQAVIVGTQIGRVKVTNNGSGQITLTNLKFTQSGTTAATNPTFVLKYSDQNSTNYVGYTASSSAGYTNSSSSINYTNMTVTIDGGSYRYFTVAIATAGDGAASGDTYQLSVSAIGDVKYSVTETNLGYDYNANSDLADTVTGLYADGKPSLGTLVKQ